MKANQYKACIAVRNKHRALGEGEGASRKKRKNAELKMNNRTQRVKWCGELENLLEEWDKEHQRPFKKVLWKLL